MFFFNVTVHMQVFDDTLALVFRYKMVKNDILWTFFAQRQVENGTFFKTNEVVN